MPQMAPLTERLQVGESVVGRVMVQMGRRKDDAGGTKLVESNAPRRLTRPAAAVAPPVGILIEPAAARNAENFCAVRTRAVFTPTPRPAEADELAELGPVDRVEPSKAGADRHEWFCD